jgi:hypothetical protein
MNCGSSFIRLGTWDVDALATAIQAQPASSWDSNSYRQHRFSAHRDTQSLYFIFDPDFRHEHPTHHALFTSLKPLLSPLLSHIAAIYNDNGTVVRCLATRLAPLGCIQPHRDHGFSLTHAHRVHIPLISSDMVDFRVADDSVTMVRGEMWEINNVLLHEVVNRGDSPRTHLIVDWAPPMTRWERHTYYSSRHAFARPNGAK